ncbi:DUF3883 domain-containing protein [Nucisporomicrobium flavum]|uniref:DUF3883 domain-containing protein n=1 Tax=Nucisporomicrobium flavum TaxID=2785915 RepID=UPI003C2E823C
MAIPPDPILRAAVRWLDRLPQSSVARCRALFSTHQDFSDITPTQYDAAYQWLAASKLLVEASNVSSEWRVFAAASSLASWFPDADLLIAGPDELPADAVRAATVLGISDQTAYGLVAANWTKVDIELRQRIGLGGEVALAALLETGLDAAIDHVAVYADGFGYDLAVVGESHEAHLEVKSTMRSGRLTIYLSRNEFETMRRDDSWRLIAVRLNSNLELIAVGTIPSGWIASEVPADRHSYGRWESCRLDVPPHVVEPGIPVCLPMLRQGASGLITGKGGWQLSSKG